MVRLVLLVTTGRLNSVKSMRITWSEPETGGRKGTVFISLRFRAQSDCLNNQFEYGGIKVKIQFDHYTQI